MAGVPLCGETCRTGIGAGSAAGDEAGRSLQTPPIRQLHIAPVHCTAAWGSTVLYPPSPHLSFYSPRNGSPPIGVRAFAQPSCSEGLFGSSRVQYVVDDAMKIVFLNTDPSIVTTYDAVQNVHSVWTLRRVKSEEENVVLKFSEQGGTPQNVATSSSLTAHLRSLSKGDSPVISPFRNYSSIHSQSRSTSSPSLHSRSPSISNMAALSRAHSPALGVHSFSGVQRFNISSHNQSPKRHSISHSPNSNSNGSFLAPETEPIVPELCIDHLWTETITNISSQTSAASASPRAPVKTLVSGPTMECLGGAWGSALLTVSQGQCSCWPGACSAEDRCSDAWRRNMKSAAAHIQGRSLKALQTVPPIFMKLIPGSHSLVSPPSPADDQCRL
nr:anaphase-promoting complex subunit 1-like [Gorilla gorilla gorilla]